MGSVAIPGGMRSPRSKRRYFSAVHALDVARRESRPVRWARNHPQRLRVGGASSKVAASAAASPEPQGCSSGRHPAQPSAGVLPWPGLSGGSRKPAAPPPIEHFVQDVPDLPCPRRARDDLERVRATGRALAWLASHGERIQRRCSSSV